MRILVTNDDGIDSVGLHVLANAMRPFGDVTVVAPASEYSGAGASLGTLTFGEPTAQQHTNIEMLAGIDAWAVTGPPALCVMYAQLGAFGDEPFDLIISGINPGQNVGWSVYHSGTIGATLTGRNRGASGLAVSIGIQGFDFEGQTWPEIVAGMQWETAARVAAQIVEGMIASPTESPTVINCNVPNGSYDDIQGWRTAPVGTSPPRVLTTSSLVETTNPEHTNENVGPDGQTGGDGKVFKLTMDWGQKGSLVEGTDAWLVQNKYVSVTWLGHLNQTTPDPAQLAAVSGRLDETLGSN